jgi:hypothetical protein
LIDQVLFKTEVPTNSSAIIVTFFTAFKTPFLEKPFHRHVNPTASCSPVDACSSPNTTSSNYIYLNCWISESKICLVNFNDNTHITLILNLIIQIYSIFCYPIVKITNVINENVTNQNPKLFGENFKIGVYYFDQPAD